ncbi:proton-conducting transporter membrane subunit [Amaricoccus macauensis]|uniref:proton-conducting transporter transmembrane domain-containing protein n=1 Tax=Amaricoccus macauensis TaxID=57001 RepID=UPI003C7DC4A1
MLLFWPIVIPLLTAVFTLLAWRSTEMQRGISITGAVALLISSIQIFSDVQQVGPISAQSGGWIAPYGITLVADTLSAVMLLLTGVVGVAIVIFSTTDVSREEEHFGFHPLTHSVLTGICGAFLTGDIFNLYVWFEVMLIATFGLLVIGGGKAQFDGAVKYVGLNLIATVAIIAGVGLLYGTTGSLNMADLHGLLEGRSGEAVVLASGAFLFFAFGSKAALFPVNFWLPASYHTPSATTSALFAALLTKVGVYSILRIFTLVYDVEGTIFVPLFFLAALSTMFFGAMGTLSQNNVFRLLGFSIIASVGFMMLGLAIGTPLALAGAAFYLFQDVLAKAGLFLGAGAAARLTGSELFARSGGIWKARIGFSLLFLIPALSLAGVPPLAGFWAKLLLVQAALEVNGYFLTLAILGTGFLLLYAMGRVWAAVFWSPHPAGDRAIQERLGATSILPLLSISILIIFIGVYAGTFVTIALEVGQELTDPSAYVEAVLGGAEASGGEMESVEPEVKE